MNRTSWVLVGIALVAAVGCGPSKAPQEAKEPPRPVRVEPVTRIDMEATLVYGAELLPSIEVKLYSTIMDRILSFPFEDGDGVVKGDVVAMVRREGLDRGLDQIAAQLASLDVQIRNLESELERARDLLAKGVATQQAFDQVRTTYESTLAQRKALVAGRGQLAATAANAVVKAPISGIFAGKMLEAGDIASPQVPLGRILVVDPLKVTLKLVESDVTRVQVGQEVLLDLDAWPGRVFAGRLTRILPYLDPETRTNTVEVTLANPRNDAGEHELKPGMYGRARLVTGRKTGVVVAPEEALLLDTRLGGEPGVQLRKAVVVGSDDTAQIRTVRLGARDGTRWEILEGLAEGERLVTRGHHGVKEGQRLAVQVEEAAR